MRNVRRAVLLGLLAVTLCVPAGVFAQSDEGAEGRKVTIPLEKKAKVVQKKLYPQVMKHEVNLFLGVNAMDDLVFNLAEGLRYNFRFHEMFGFQVVGGYVQTFDKDLMATLRDNDLDDKQVKNSSLLWWGGGDFVWYPMYGKFAFLSDMIAHYDLGVSLGAAAMGLDGGDIAPAPDVGVFANLYFNRWLSLRVDAVYYILIAEDKREVFKGNEGATIGSTGVSAGAKRGGTLARHNLFGTVGLSFHLPP